jgi:hypothetical protein
MASLKQKREKSKINMINLKNISFKLANKYKSDQQEINNQNY